MINQETLSIALFIHNFWKWQTWHHSVDLSVSVCLSVCLSVACIDLDIYMLKNKTLVFVNYIYWNIRIKYFKTQTVSVKRPVDSDLWVSQADLYIIFQKNFEGFIRRKVWLYMFCGTLHGCWNCAVWCGFWDLNVEKCEHYWLLGYEVTWTDIFLRTLLLGASLFATRTIINLASFRRAPRAVVVGVILTREPLTLNINFRGIPVK